MKLYFTLLLLSLTFFLTNCSPPPQSACANSSTPNLRCVPTFGTLLDTRDSTTYQTVTICNQTWMAEDLNYDTPNNVHLTISNPYSSSSDTTLWGVDTVVYGKRLYNGVSMMVSCPNGWHIPSGREMSILEINLGMNPLDTVPVSWGGQTPEEVWFRACGILPSMLSTTGWQNKGNNSSGFNLMGPSHITLWTSTLHAEAGYTLQDYNDPRDASYWGRDYYVDNDYIRKYPQPIQNWHSCRCLQD